MSAEPATADDLYGDLGSVAPAPAPPSPQRPPPPPTAVDETAALRARVAALETEARVWAAQRAVLVANLGALLRTAKAVDARRVREIRQLREEAAAAAAAAAATAAVTGASAEPGRDDVRSEVEPPRRVEPPSGRRELLAESEPPRRGDDSRGLRGDGRDYEEQGSERRGDGGIHRRWEARLEFTRGDSRRESRDELQYESRGESRRYPEDGGRRGAVRGYVEEATGRRGDERPDRRDFEPRSERRRAEARAHGEHFTYRRQSSNEMWRGRRSRDDARF